MLIILALVACASLGQALPSEGVVRGISEHMNAWNDFKSTYARNFETVEEETKRFLIFANHRTMIKKHNDEESKDGRHGFETGINEYADMSNEEFVKTMNGFKQPPQFDNQEKFVADGNTALPTEIDWRKKGYVTPVKNQGQCGSCWAFSSTGGLEGQHFKKTGKLVSLSEQNLVDCAGTFGAQGCGGGWMDQAFQYISQNGGIDTETAYPYMARNERCNFKNGTQYVGATDKGFVSVTRNDEKALQQAVGSIGPVSIAIDASHWSFQMYKSGVYNEPKCNPQSLDHAVLIVGYGTAQDGTPYWIVKNSWGKTWGQDGYILMSRNKNNQCGIASHAVYPKVQ